MNKLVQSKQIIIQEMDKVVDFDLSQLEYLVHLIDYMILGNIPYSEDVIRNIIDEMLVASYIQQSSELLKAVSLVAQYVKENKLCTIV